MGRDSLWGLAAGAVNEFLRGRNVECWWRGPETEIAHGKKSTLVCSDQYLLLVRHWGLALYYPPLVSAVIVRQSCTVQYCTSGEGLHSTSVPTCTAERHPSFSAPLGSLCFSKRIHRSFQRQTDDEAFFCMFHSVYPFFPNLDVPTATMCASAFTSTAPSRTHTSAYTSRKIAQMIRSKFPILCK